MAWPRPRKPIIATYYLVVEVSGTVFFSCSVSVVVVGVVFFFLAGAFFLGAGVLTALFEPPQPADPQAVF
jgi:hypothetical protein